MSKDSAEGTWGTTNPTSRAVDASQARRLKDDAFLHSHIALEAFLATGLALSAFAEPPAAVAQAFPPSAT